MTSLGMIIILSLLGSVLALVGGVVFLFIKPWSKFLSRYSVSFAAGVLLTVALIGLLPEAAHEIGDKAYLLVLLTFLGAYLFENFACSLHHHDHDCEAHSPTVEPSNLSRNPVEALAKAGEAHGSQPVGTTSLIIVGDSLHNFIDGVAIAAAYLANPGLGWVMTLSTFLHEVPHEIGDFGILLKKGWPRKKILIVNIISALFTLLGALAVIFILPDQGIVSYLLAAAAGMFLYLGASDFLPHAHEDLSRKKALLSLFVGVAVMLGALKIIPHSHGHDNHPDHETFSDQERQIEKYFQD
ncbi:ZIP family metal transporter [Patescibacteria group bacterium]